jgi:hypothetical protein
MSTVHTVEVADSDDSPAQGRGQRITLADDPERRRCLWGLGHRYALTAADGESVAAAKSRQRALESFEIAEINRIFSDFL